MSDDPFLVTWCGRTAVVAVPEEVDLTNADGLRDALLGALNAGAPGLVVDLTRTTFCDSAGVTALARAARRAAASETVMRLAVASPAVLRVLNLVGVDRLIDVYPSVPEAVSSLPDQTGAGQATVTDSCTRAPSGPDETDAYSQS